MVHEEALISVTGELARPGHGREKVLKSPGLLRKHYAPRAKLVIWSWTEEHELQEKGRISGVPESKIHVIAHTRIPSGGLFARVSVIPHDAEAFARAIYSELHRCDELGAELIVIEALPETGQWLSISDRLARAAAN